MDLPVMVLILLLLGATWLFIRRRQTPKDDDQQDITRASGPGTEYHAVSIKLSGNACRAAREMEGRRFLSSAAPKLPLAECDVLECKCRFVHHQDRRIAKDRRTPFGPSGFGTDSGNYEEEHRQRDNRRSNKDEDLF